MSWKTTPAFVHTGDWDAETDSHPAMKFMRDCTSAWDDRSAWSNWDKWTTSDFQYAKSTGEVFPKGQKSRDEARAAYEVFTAHHHELYFMICWELPDGSGWEMAGNAWLYGNLPGNPSSGARVTDLQGKEWQVRGPGGFHFVYKKEGNDIKVASTSITSDSGPAMVELLKRGVMKPADLGL